MKMKNSILLILYLFSSESHSNLPGTFPLFAQIKNNQLCIFTQNNKTELGYKDRAYIYTINLNEKRSRSDDYEKIYYNIKLPIRAEDCISIPLNNLERNKPHDIFIELDKTYSLRVCISNKNEIYKVNKLQQCSNELYFFENKYKKPLIYDFLFRLKEYILGLFNRFIFKYFLF